MKNERASYTLKEGEPLDDEKRKVLEQAIRRCNMCQYAHFPTRSCVFDKENPVDLSVYESSRGYVYLLRPRCCRNYLWRGEA